MSQTLGRSSKSNELPIAVDAMGGDDAPEVIVAGAVAASKEGLPVCLVGDQDVLRPLLGRADVQVVHASQVVAMDESATSAIKQKPEASISAVMEAVASGQASGAVSFGHSGATLVSAVVKLGLLDGVRRPAIAILLPRADGGRLVLLDAGANIDCKPEQLVRFAHLGSAYAATLGLKQPRIGLLSNGQEASKGNELGKQTLALLQQESLHVVGNVEPQTALQGQCDVLVCDGFVGNVLLKSLEGASELAVSTLWSEVKRGLFSRLGALLLRRALWRFQRRLAWDAHGGGLLLGVAGVVVVGHGRTNARAVKAAIALAHETQKRGLCLSLEKHLTSITPQKN